MPLSRYREKRSFDQTPEPTGEAQAQEGALRFVVQKHAARRLHYDFRLELDGVLKSWAVPKGPSLNPDDKRLAMMVEDHPLDYAGFEGIIPAGNYGAGTVIVWDQGAYQARGAQDRAASEEAIRRGLKRGDLKLLLDGTKLRGEFALVKMKTGEPNAWLLIKKTDQFANTEDVTAQNRSVLSGRTVEEAALGQRQAARVNLDGIPQGKLPHKVRPMLATGVDAPFDRKGWLFEPKWDGYRAIAEIENGQVRLYSRKGLHFLSSYAPVVQTLKGIGQNAVLDGEIVVLDARGRPHFNLLQNYGKSGQGKLVYFVFDLLHLDGHDLMRVPLKRRKELLAEFVRGLPNVAFCEHVEDQGVAFFRAAGQQGLEGMIGKDGQSKYTPGLRSKHWLKVKGRQRQEAVIGGFTQPRGQRKGFGSVVLGVYEGDDLVYIGNAGSGLTERGVEELHKQLLELVQPDCPFRVKPKTDMPAKWVEPKLVCEVAFQEWSHDGHLRFPIFMGLREDKPPKSVHRETTMPAPVERPPAPSPAVAPKLTNLNKIYWPEDGYTKGDLIEYYRSVSSFILPVLHDRPLSLNRHPDGIHGKSFYQKDVTRQPPPDWVRTAPLDSDTRGEITYLICQDEPTLLYVANLGCIEINPWNSRVGHTDRPDYVVIDLDPEDIGFEKVVEAAVMVRRLLDKIEVASYCKTSGKTGLHIYLPLGARYDYDQARQFAELIATLINRKVPAFTSIIRDPKRRQGKVYLDFLQNRRGQTLASAYSVRPVVGAWVSTPLKWSEVTRRLDPSCFTIRTLAKRLDRVGDLWQPVLDGGLDLVGALERIGKLSRW